MTVSADLYLTQINAATSTAALEDIRVALLGKKGSVTELMKTLGALPPEERKAQGAAINALKEQLSAALDARKASLSAAELAEKLTKERVDITLPAAVSAPGALHPINNTILDITCLFAAQGFTVASATDVEDEFHNFDALNFPPDHPAKAMHDTFYMQDGKLLRTHTSTVQVHTLQTQKPPLRILAPGRVYRCDSDQTHAPMFHQIEGFVVEPGIHFGHLKGTLERFLSDFFGIPNLPVRFRPSFFPFTEPSAEVDIGCDRSGGGLKIGSGGDWLEVLGCGMIHPNVLRQCGLDPAVHQGFAFGMGVERLAMLKHGIPDLRAFFAGNSKWLRHFGRAPLGGLA